MNDSISLNGALGFVMLDVQDKIILTLRLLNMLWLYTLYILPLLNMNFFH